LTEDGPVTADHLPQGSGAPSLQKELYSGALPVMHMTHSHTVCSEQTTALASCMHQSTDSTVVCRQVFYLFARGEDDDDRRRTP
jgi:hypothetical protein